ncbi:MAG: hypothetical protein HY737_02345 [Candidatus Omnitrophica bacterium]|nr:hypothetical protein [Candidatus Omnitrophota bacterium]
MNRWSQAIGLLVALSVGIGIGWMSRPAVWAAEEDATPPVRSSRATTKSAAASTTSSSSGNAKLEKKLDEILANQQDILKRFDAVMEELKIIKVRATIAASRGGS